VEANTPYIPTSENTWCASPWTEIHIDQGGEMVFCCQAKHVVGNVNENSIKEIFNGREYKKARLETLSNIWPKGCELCERAEKVSNRSMRYQQQESYESNLNIIQPDINKDYKIQKFKIDFSNACNLRCTMCSPHRSTGWFKDAKMLMDSDLTRKEISRAVRITEKVKGEPYTIETYGIPSSVIDDNLDIILDTKMIDISGGEPFYTPQFKYLVDKLVEHNYKGRLKVITNLTLLDQEYVEKLKNINTTLIVSMDATGHLYEYVRPSTPFGKYKGKDIQNKIIELKHEHGFDMAISYTPQLLNVYNIQEYVHWLQEAKIKPRHEFMFNGPVTSPRYLTIAVHPDTDYKLRLADMLERDFGNTSRLNGVINLCRKPRDSEVINYGPSDNHTEIENWKFFCKITEMLDKQRKTSILNYIPQLEKYWVSNK
tara:strand:- start:782 stop:2065 length:1284 start_codon:yes stop_codon:yes gene_type:complete